MNADALIGVLTIIVEQTPSVIADGNFASLGIIKHIRGTFIFIGHNRKREPDQYACICETKKKERNIESAIIKYLRKRR